MSLKAPITLNINGRDHAIEVEPRRTLVDAFEAVRRERAKVIHVQVRRPDANE